jgi:hypothetical protein
LLASPPAPVVHIVVGWDQVVFRIKRKPGSCRNWQTEEWEPAFAANRQPDPAERFGPVPPEGGCRDDEVFQVEECSPSS